MDSDIAALPATDLVKLVRARQLSTAEVLENCSRRIERGVTGTRSSRHVWTTP